MMTVQLHIKPLSANAAFKGRKFKTAAYKNYEKALMMLLPNNYEIPEGPLEVFYEFGITAASDWDNPIKQLQDILCKRYNFDDRRIMKGTVTKKVVKKVRDICNFQFGGWNERTTKLLRSLNC